MGMACRTDSPADFSPSGNLLNNPLGLRLGLSDRKQQLLNEDS